MICEYKIILLLILDGLDWKSLGLKIYKNLGVNIVGGMIIIRF